MKRARLYILWLVGLAAMIASLVLANLLAERFPVTLDVTVSGEHRLSPRSAAVLDRLEGRASLLIATDFSRADPDALRDTSDVLSRFERTGRVELSLLDTSSPRGSAAFRESIARLIERDKETLASQVATLRSISGSAEPLARWMLEALAPGLASARDALPAGSSPDAIRLRETLDQAAAAARLAGQDLLAAPSRLGVFLNATLGEFPLPQTDQAASRLLADLRSASDSLSRILGDLRRAASTPGLSDAASSRLTDLLAALAPQRDRLIVLADSLSRWRAPGVLRIAATLRGNEAAILVPPRGDRLLAIPMIELFPPAAAVASPGMRADNRRRVEEVLTAALASLLLEHQPIAVFVHAEEKPFVLEAPFLARLRENLSLRSIDIVEWPVLSDPEPKGLDALNPDRARRVVYISIPPDSAAPARAGESRGGIDRAARLGEALDRLVAQDASILLSINPSIQRSFGETDSLTPLLARFGLHAASGRPVLTQRTAQGQRTVETDRVVTSEASAADAAPILAAIRGLPTMLPWPIGISSDPNQPPDRGGSISITRLHSIPADAATWGESRWLRLWQTPRAQRARLTELPTYDAGQDDAGPWDVALAVERSLASSSSPADARTPVQRAVIVGASGWFMDPLTQATATIDGRTLAPYPGNQELFDSAFYWLAFADDLIAQSPQAGAIPLIGPIHPDRLLLLRLLIILGLPALVLALGVLYRAATG